MNEPEQQTNPPPLVATLLWALGVAVLICLALTLGRPDTAWEQVQQDAKALQTEKTRQFQAKALEVTNLLRQLKYIEPSLRTKLDNLPNLTEEEYKEFLTDLQLAVEFKKAKDAFKQHGDWEPKIQNSERIRKQIQARRFAEYQQDQKLQQESLKHMMGAKPKLALLILGGVVAALFLNRAPELRFVRMLHVVLIPSILVSMNYTLVPAYEKTHTTEADMTDFLGFLPAILVLGLILAPSIAHIAAVTLENTIDPHDWKVKKPSRNVLPWCIDLLAKKSILLISGVLLVFTFLKTDLAYVTTPIEVPTSRAVALASAYTHGSVCSARETSNGEYMVTRYAAGWQVLHEAFSDGVRSVLRVQHLAQLHKELILLLMVVTVFVPSYRLNVLALQFLLPLLLWFPIGSPTGDPRMDPPLVFYYLAVVSATVALIWNNSRFPTEASNAAKLLSLIAVFYNIALLFLFVPQVLLK